MKKLLFLLSALLLCLTNAFAFHPYHHSAFHRSYHPYHYHNSAKSRPSRFKPAPAPRPVYHEPVRYHYPNSTMITYWIIWGGLHKHHKIDGKDMKLCPSCRKKFIPLNWQVCNSCRKKR